MRFGLEVCLRVLGGRTVGSPQSLRDRDSLLTRQVRRRDSAKGWASVRCRTMGRPSSFGVPSARPPSHAQRRQILDRLIDIAPKGAENVMLGSGNLPVCAEESDNAFRSAWGPASSVHKRSYCPLDRRVIASELEAIAAPPLCSTSCRVWACLLESKATSATAHLLRSESAKCVSRGTKSDPDQHMTRCSRKQVI